TPFNTAVVSENVTVNTAITVTPAAFDGYEFDADNALNSPTAVTALANGKLTLKYYYTQKTPTLQVANDGTVTFDNLGDSFSYDLYIGGNVAQRNVVSGETNVYTDKIVTVTGVYEAQLVVSAEGGEEFARSAEVQFATGFLNENEIYSFDNNYAAAGTVNGNVTKEVQSEITHGDSAYALKVTSSGSGARITLDLSERPLEKNARISYWIYVVKPEGATGDTTGTRTNVPQGFEGTLGRFSRTYSESGSSTVPYETWTKMYTYVHGNTSRLDLFCFAWDCPVDNYVFYMDDIYVEEMDYETGDGIYNMVLTSDNGGHFTFTSEQYGSDIAVGDEVDVTMKIKVSTTDVGTDYGFFTIKAGGEEKTIANKDSYSTEWKEVSFRVTVTAAQANLKKWQMDFAEGISLVWMNNSLVMGYISMKDVTFTKYVPLETPADTAEITLTAVANSGGAGPYATTLLPVDDSIKAGATVKVTMTTAISATGNYTRFHTVKDGAVGGVLYGDATGKVDHTFLLSYGTFTFEATVVENQSFTYHGAATPTTGKGVAILCVSMPAAGDK
ncbi:MAG: hypothetical protein IJB97_07400, partial [Clostridia bacterium]|nr:hypothetical protein [Clostridia bacterium]